MSRIAIIGAGPGGLVAAKFLQQHGFDPVLFEQAPGLGGQWRRGEHSGIWPSMRTNTSRVMTAFSDLDHPDGSAVYPHNENMLAYLQRYAAQHGLDARLRSNTRVLAVRREAGGPGWQLRAQTAGQAETREHYDRVVIATGRFQHPALPAIPGLAGFSGRGGVSHSVAYRGAEPYAGQRVLVLGCSISALEIATELARHDIAVITSARRQRYVVQKIVAGVPTDYRAFSRFAALAAESLPPEVSAQGLKAFVVSTSGSPEQFGAPRPADNIFEAGITQSQTYLAMVAEARISARGWIDRIDGRDVQFTDGSRAEVDAIICATGFDLRMPFLEPALERRLLPGEGRLDLYAHTLDPDTPDLALVGQFDVVGPAFPVLELQARWLAYLWSGQCPAPDAATLQAGRAMARQMPAQLPLQMLALQFARLAGVEPDPVTHPALARALLFGPLSPVSFRLSGPDALSDAAARTAAVASLYGAMPQTALNAVERQQLAALAAARQSPGLAALAS